MENQPRSGETFVENIRKENQPRIGDTFVENYRKKNQPHSGETFAELFYGVAATLLYGWSYFISTKLSLLRSYNNIVPENLIISCWLLVVGY